MLLSALLESLNSTPLLVVAASTLFLYILLAGLKRKPRLPPQPGLALPIIGHLYMLEPNPLRKFREWKKKHGDIFSLYLGGNLTIVLNGHKAVKEALVHKGEFFNDRPVQFYDITSGTIGRGLISSNGPDWKEQRSTVTSSLRRLGMGKNVLAQRITEEVMHFTRRLEDLQSRGSCDVRAPITMAISNITCSLLVGRRFEYADMVFKGLLQCAEQVILALGCTNPLHVYPVLRFLPGDPFKGGQTARSVKKVMELFSKTYCQRVREGGDCEIDLDNLIASYMHEMEAKRQSGASTYLDEKSLERIVFDMFFPGSETTSTLLHWSVMFAIHHPDAQQKLFQEILREIGTERLPTMQDKSKLVYLNAFIMETQRASSITPFGLPHTNLQPSTLGEWEIPAGTHVLTNIESVHKDPEIWGDDVMSFRPERFLDASGHNLAPREELIPFSTGKRSCPAESLANMELFLFLSIMFQRFEFLPKDTDNQLPSLKPVFGIIQKTVPFEVRVVSRKN